MNKLVFTTQQHSLTLCKFENAQGYTALLECLLKSDMFCNKYKYLFFNTVQEAVDYLMGIEGNA